MNLVLVSPVEERERNLINKFMSNNGASAGGWVGGEKIFLSDD